MQNPKDNEVANRGFAFENLVELFEQTHRTLQQRAARSVDLTLVVRNWLFGWYIVEYEQRGEDRARYGSRLLASLSNRLKVLGIKGNSSTRLKLYRSFYQQHKEIGPTVPDQSTPLSRLLGTFPIRPTASDQSVLSRSEPFSFEAIIDLLISRFTLGWSHYVTLLTIDNPDERQFYEIEASRNSWSVRELERQIASSLYERLALSRDKNDIRRLAREGQVVEKAADIIKNPFVLEFLGLEEKPAYSENELESAIIDRLESFLLELGRGVLFEARQKRFTFDNDHFYVDLVFYNRLLRCYVIIDLKRDKLTHQDLGQMQMSKIEAYFGDKIILAA
jgi:predicted nuclease of restriction endonuclease-like (RecB) superfamily